MDCVPLRFYIVDRICCFSLLSRSTGNSGSARGLCAQRGNETAIRFIDEIFIGDSRHFYHDFNIEYRPVLEQR